MAQKSIAKGSAFEREVAKKLSLWVTNGEDKYVFCRRSGSGGAQRDKQGFTNFTGDIFADKAIGKKLTDAISFELKFYKNLDGDVFNLLTGRISKQMQSFIEQAQTDSAIHNRKFFLIVKANNRQAFILTDFVKGLKSLNKKCNISYSVLFVERNKEYLIFNFNDLFIIDYCKFVNLIEEL